MAKTWDAVVKDALDMHLHKENYCYFYGAKGELMTDSYMNELWNSYPDYFKKYNSQQKKAIFDYSRGKRGYDCSGFVCKCLGYDMVYSGALWDNCTSQKADKYAGVAGSVLWRPGHVGLDIGYGYFLHFPSEGHSCELGRLKENTVDWTGSGQFRTIDYTGADNR